MRVQVGTCSVETYIGEFPPQYHVLHEHVSLVEEFDLDGRNDEEGHIFVCTLGCELQAPLMVAQRYQPYGSGFRPGVLVVPETRTAFFGAGTRLLAYDLNQPRRLWEDTTDIGFWWWDRVSDVVLMAAELELAAWTIQGEKLWTTFVEPPWGYTVQSDQIVLDVMGIQTEFDHREGPMKGTQI